MIGIFPEGGSHDRTELLPFKPGACIFAFELKKRFNKNVPLVPCSINYSNAHKFRSRVVIKIGKPLSFDFDESRKEDSSYKREKVSEMLKTLKEKMTALKLTAPNYQILKILNCAKDIYLEDQKMYTRRQHFEILKKFTEAYEVIKDNEEVVDLMS